jgi:translation initiation factor 1
MVRDTSSTLVYSSETGMVPQTLKNSIKSVKPQTKPLTPSDGTVRLRREVKGRGGGTVIVITGLPLNEAGLKELAGILKKRCGCGGTVKEGVVEIQGDHRDKIQAELLTRGYRVKLAGG